MTINNNESRNNLEDEKTKKKNKISEIKNKHSEDFRKILSGEFIPKFRVVDYSSPEKRKELNDLIKQQEELMERDKKHRRRYRVYNYPQ